MSRSHRLPRLLSPLVAALALLVAAAPAAAETRTGEATSPVNGAIPHEADLLGATAKYDSSTGEVTFTATTRVRPGSEDANSPLELAAALGVRTHDTCALPEIGYPAMEVVASYKESVAAWGAVENEGEFVTEPEPALKSVVGTTTTLIASSPKLIEKPYDCAVVAVTEFNGMPKEFDEVNFPISVPAPPPPETPATTPGGGTGTATATPSSTAAPTPTPGVLSFLGSRPLAAKAGKWTTLTVRIANTGGTAIGPIAIKAKAPAGVTLKSKTLKLPALLPGQAWPLRLQVKLTAKAKPRSTIALSGTSAGPAATGSIVVRATRRRR